MSPPDLEVLSERLLRGGVAPRHVRRYLRELSEHYDDALSAELARGVDRAAAEQAARARLGSEDSLVQSVLARPELRSTSARFPGLVFGAGPLLTWLGLAVVTVGMIRLLSAGAARAVPPAWVPDAAYALCILYVRVLPVLLGVVVFVSAARRRLRLYWPFAGVALLHILAGTFSVQLFGAVGQLGVSSSLLPLLVPCTDALGPKDILALAEGSWRAAGMLAVTTVAYRASARRWAA